MTEQERIELLKQVADCAPEWMQAYPINGGVGFGAVHASYWNCDNPTKADAQLNLLFDDISNAPAIVAMLDAMRSHPCCCFFTVYLGGATFTCELSVVEGELVQARGKTLAEAIARAFVKVFGKEKA